MPLEITDWINFFADLVRSIAWTSDAFVLNKKLTKGLYCEKLEV